MKVHTDLKELLNAYEEYTRNMEHYGLTHYKVNITNFLTFNSLALGKPEPLAKNKQFDNACGTCGKPIISLYNTNLYCDEKCHQKACTQA